MFDPIFDAFWFVKTFAFPITVFAYALTLVVILCVFVYHFIEDEIEEDDVGPFIAGAIFMPILAGLFTLGASVILPFVISYLWFPVSIISVLTFLIFIARGVRRLQKSIKAHTEDKNAHKGEK